MPIQEIYKFKEYVQLYMASPGSLRVNWPMVQYDLKVYKGVTNTIDFVVRNSERRPVNLVAMGLDCVIARQETGEIMLTKPIVPTMPTDGKAQLILESGDVDDFPEGYYNYVIRGMDTSGTETLLYTDINKTTTGTFQVFDGILRSELPAIEIDAKQFTQTPHGPYDGITYISGAFAGDAQSQKSNGTHTVAVYQSGWYGSFFVQASLSPDTPQDSEWFYVKLVDDEDFYIFDKDNNDTGMPTLFNFYLNAYWVRFGFTPLWADGQTYPTPQQLGTVIVNNGVFHKVIYKN